MVLPWHRCENLLLEPLSSVFCTHKSQHPHCCFFLVLLSLVASTIMPFSKSFLRVKDCAATHCSLPNITTDISPDILVTFAGLSYNTCHVLSVLSFINVLYDVFLETGQPQTYRIQYMFAFFLILYTHFPFSSYYSTNLVRVANMLPC